VNHGFASSFASATGPPRCPVCVLGV
jgi:hypothetical protein